MPAETVFPPLDNFEPTRQTMQLYSRAVTAIPRAHGEFHPKWWHVSLKVVPDGLVTDPVALPGGGSIMFTMDLHWHTIVLARNGEAIQEWDMTSGKTSTALGDELIAAVEALGLTGGSYARDKFENDDPREYDPDEAAKFLTALESAHRIFKAHREAIDGEWSPVQLWPHGFDLAVEWFGTRVLTYEEHGQVQENPSQLNLGFYPGQPIYFYSNPWPFEAGTLLGKALPQGAGWHTEGWHGTILPYAELAGDPDAEARLRAYARAVFDLVTPTLLAGWR